MDNLTTMFIKLFQSYENGLLRWEPSFEVLNSYIYDTMEMAHKSVEEESSVQNRQSTKPEKPISFVRNDNSPTPQTFDWRNVSEKNYISPVKIPGTLYSLFRFCCQRTDGSSLQHSTSGSCWFTRFYGALIRTASLFLQYRCPDRFLSLEERMD